MRYLYHLGDRNVGPVSFEQLQELAKAGTIDNMTPVLAEGAKAWSRWLFIKEAPQGAPAPAPVAKEEPAPKAEPVRPKAVPAPKQAEPEKKEKEAPKEPVKEEKKPVEKKEEAPKAEKAAEAPAPKAKAPKAAEPPQPRAACSLRCHLKPLAPWLPSIGSAVVLLICLLLCIAWQKAIADTRTQTAERLAYAAMQAQHRPDLAALESEQQELDARKAQKSSELEAQKAILEKSNKANDRFGTPSKEGVENKQKEIDSLNTQIKGVNKQIEELRK